MEKKIKIKIPGDELRAIDLGSNTARIADLTMSPEYSYDDIVMYNENNEVTMLIKKVTNSGNIKYPFALSGSQGEATRIIKHFEQIDGVKCEAMVPGFILLAYPVGIPESVIISHAKKYSEDLELELSEGEEPV